MSACRYCSTRRPIRRRLAAVWPRLNACRRRAAGRRRSARTSATSSPPARPRARAPALSSRRSLTVTECIIVLSSVSVAARSHRDTTSRSRWRRRATADTVRRSHPPASRSRAGASFRPTAAATRTPLGHGQSPMILQRNRSHRRWRRRLRRHVRTTGRGTTGGGEGGGGGGFGRKRNGSRFGVSNVSAPGFSRSRSHVRHSASSPQRPCRRLKRIGRRGRSRRPCQRERTDR